MIFFVYGNGKKMLARDEPSLWSLNEELKYDSMEPIQINQVGKILFQILENGYNTVDLDSIEGGY
jgi:hypothetical protein